MVALRGSADGGHDRCQYGVYRCRVPWTAESDRFRPFIKPLSGLYRAFIRPLSGLYQSDIGRAVTTVHGPPFSVRGARILGPDATCVNSSETAVAPLLTMGYFPETSISRVFAVSLNYQKMTVFAVLVMALCLGNEAAASEAGYYKWLDARGNPQHSDRPPPPGVEYEFISTETGLRRRVSREESSQSESSAPAMPPVARPTAAEEQVVIKKDPALCDKAKANLDTLKSSARVRIRDENGIRYLTDEEKDVQRRKAEDLISVHCSS